MLVLVSSKAPFWQKCSRTCRHPACWHASTSRYCLAVGFSFHAIFLKAACVLRSKRAWKISGAIPDPALVPLASFASPFSFSSHEDMSRASKSFRDVRAPIVIATGVTALPAQEKRCYVNLFRFRYVSIKSRIGSLATSSHSQGKLDRSSQCRTKHPQQSV